MKPLPAMPFEYCGVVPGAGPLGLPRRGGGALLQRALSAGGPGGGSAASRRRVSSACTAANGSPAMSAAVSAGRSTTLVEHMPREHRHYAEWTPQRLVRWAGETGPATAEVVEEILHLAVVIRIRDSTRVWGFGAWRSTTGRSAWRPLADGHWTSKGCRTGASVRFGPNPVWWTVYRFRFWRPVGPPFAATSWGVYAVLRLLEFIAIWRSQELVSGARG